MPEEVKQQTIEDLAAILPKLNELVDIIPDIKGIVKERKEQEIFNKQAAKLGRVIVVVAAGVGTVIATVIAVSTMIVKMGK